MTEPLRDDIIRRLAWTAAMSKRPRGADMPPAAVHTIEVNLKTGERSCKSEVVVPPPVVQPDPPAPTPPVTADQPFCGKCGRPVFKPRRKFCSELCARKFHGGYLAAPPPMPEPTAPKPAAPNNAANRVLWAVAHIFTIEVARITGKSHRRRDTEARRAAILIMYRHVGMTQSAIGRFLGHKDHTSARWAIDRAESQKIAEPEWARRYEAAVELFLGEAPTT